MGSRFLKEIRDLHIESSGEFHDCGQRGATFTAQNLRQVALGEICFKIEAVQRAVFLDHYLS